VRDDASGAGVDVGDLVSFTVSDVVDSEGRLEVGGFNTLSITGSGDVSTLVQNFENDAALVSGIADRESELQRTEVTLLADVASNAGAGFLKGAAATTAISAAPTGITLRLAPSLAQAAGFTAGCKVTVESPLGHTNFGTDEVQVTAWELSQITGVNECLAVVESAVPTSATEVVVTFSRAVDAASVLANGSQFEIIGDVADIAVTAATVDGNTVTLTTEAQTSGEDYLLQVGTTVLDIFGSLYDEDNADALFLGFADPAALLVNEIAPNLANNCDLVELLVTAPGSLGAIIAAGRDNNNLAPTALPPITVAAGDLVVLHFGADSATCNPNNETFETAKGQFTGAGDFANAFDVYVVGALTGTNGIITLTTGAVTLDAVPYANNVVAGAGCGSGGASRTSFDAAVAAGAWLTAAGGVPVTPSSNDNYCVDSAGGSTFSTALSGNSAQRTSQTDTNTRNDFAMVPGTFGALNAGQ
jgi:hypothetical protein